MSNLRLAEQQLSLFDHSESLHRAMDGVRKRYGYEALRFSSSQHDE